MAVAAQGSIKEFLVGDFSIFLNWVFTMKIHQRPYQVYMHMIMHTFHIYQWTFQVKVFKSLWSVSCTRVYIHIKEGWDLMHDFEHFFSVVMCVFKLSKSDPSLFRENHPSESIEIWLTFFESQMSENHDRTIGSRRLTPLMSGNPIEPVGLDDFCSRKNYPVGSKDPNHRLGGGNSKIFYFQPLPGEWSKFD